MSNIIEIPNLVYSADKQAYYEEDTQLINVDNISIVEPKYFSNGTISRYIIHFSRDIYTYTNKKGYDLIKNFENEKNESTKDTIL